MSEINKENLVRVLKGLDKIQRLRCRLDWHRWTTWEIVERSHDFQLPHMKCYCADCGILRLEQPVTKNK